MRVQQSIRVHECWRSPKRERELTREQTHWKRTRVDESAWELVVKRERELTKVQTHWKRMRVDESAWELVVKREWADESSNSLKTHESRWERMRVTGQTRVRADARGRVQSHWKHVQVDENACELVVKRELELTRVQIHWECTRVRTRWEAHEIWWSNESERFNLSIPMKIRIASNSVSTSGENWVDKGAWEIQIWNKIENELSTLVIRSRF